MDVLTLAAINLLLGIAIFFSTTRLALSQPDHLYWRWFAGCGAALTINSLCGLLFYQQTPPHVMLQLVANVATISLHCCLLFGVGQLVRQPQNYQWLWLPISVALLHTLPELQQNLQLRLLVCFAAIILLNGLTLKILLPTCRQSGRFAFQLLSATLMFNLLQLAVRWLLYLLEALPWLSFTPPVFVHQLGFFCLTIMAALTLASFLTLLVEQQQQSLQTQAHTDALTGLLNRHQLEHKIQALLNQCNRQQQSVALLVLDIDYFKRVNDHFGHSCGDLVLQAVAGSCRHDQNELPGL